MATPFHLLARASCDPKRRSDVVGARFLTVGPFCLRLGRRPESEGSAKTASYNLCDAGVLFLLPPLMYRPRLSNGRCDILVLTPFRRLDARFGRPRRRSCACSAYLMVISDLGVPSMWRRGVDSPAGWPAPPLFVA